MSITDLPIKLTLAKGNFNAFIIDVSADSNDADYIYNTTCYTPEEFAEAIPAIHLLNDIDGWGDCASSYHPCPVIPEDLGDYIYDLIPNNEYGCHSISLDSIKYVSPEGVLYDVELTN